MREEKVPLSLAREQMLGVETSLELTAMRANKAVGQRDRYRANALRLATAMWNRVSRSCFFCLPTCAATRSSSSPTSEKVSCRPASHRNLLPTITDTLDRSLRL